MKRFDERPIKQRLMAITLLTSAVVLLLAGVPFVVYEIVTFKRSAVTDLAALGEIIASNSTASLAFSNTTDATDVLSALRARPHIVAAALYDADGRLFASYPSELPETSFPAAPGSDGVAEAGSHLVEFRPVVESSNRRLGTLYLEADTEAIAERIRLYAALAVGVIALSLLAGYIVSSTLHGRISSPILALADTARAVAERNDYSVRAPKLAQAEIGLLTDAFNQMLGQIEKQDRMVRESRERLDIALRADNAALERRVNERTAELESANEELRAFSYSVSHDLRAPLRAVTGFSAILIEDHAAQLPPEARDMAERIAAGGRRMERLIEDLLRLAHLSYLPLTRDRVDMNALVHEVIGEVRAQYPDRAIETRVDTVPDCVGDRSLLKQVVVNLASNAFKFTRGRDPAVVHVGSETASNTTVYFVRDNGAGFDARNADKLFGVFQRLHAASEFDGTGVGLSIVRRIVNRHAGRVWAEAEPEKGATFRFSLPA